MAGYGTRDDSQLCRSHEIGKARRGSLTNGRDKLHCCVDMSRSIASMKLDSLVMYLVPPK